MECKWGDTPIDSGLRNPKTPFPDCWAWQVSAIGTKGFVSRRPSAPAPALMLLRRLPWLLGARPSEARHVAEQRVTLTTSYHSVVTVSAPNNRVSRGHADRRPRLEAALVVALPSVVFAVHGLTFGSWIVDDAGISFAYARNLAAGHGLVAQPGIPPVEGFSNFLWVLLMAPFFAVGLFQPAWTPKVVALGLIAGSFALMHRALALSRAWSPLSGLAAFCLIALQTSVVAWALSGLENALYVFVLSALLERMTHVVGQEGSPRTGAVIGLLAALASMTRPDGVVYLAALPILAATRLASPGQRAWTTRLVGWYALAVVTVLGAFLALRWRYFGDLLPNPYYAKGGPTIRDVLALIRMEPGMVEKALDLVGAVAGPASIPVLAGLLLGTLALAVTRRLDVGHLVVATLLVLAVLAYLLLPGDWMKEYRFATPVFVLLYVYASLLLWPLWGLIWRSPAAQQVAFVAAACALLAGTLVLTAPRSSRFAERPTLPLAIVGEVLGHRLNRLATALDIESGSILLSDVGGTLLYSRLRVYDLHGLCDPTIARTLGRYRNLGAFHEYVLGRVRPVFIHLATPDWVRVTRFEADERFLRDYAPLAERVDADILRRSGLDAYPGQFFIRRDARVRGVSEAPSNPPGVTEKAPTVSPLFPRRRADLSR